MPKVFQEQATKEKVLDVGFAASPSDSGDFVDCLLNSPPSHQQGHSNADGEPGDGDGNILKYLEEFDEETFLNSIESI